MGAPFYLSDDLLVRGFLDADGPVVVSFQDRRNWQGLQKPCFGAAFLAKYGYAHVLVTVSTNHWYQVPDFPRALEAIRGRLEGRTAICFGNSMGASGALLASGPLAAARTLLFSPIVSIYPEEPPRERRWAQDREGSELLHRMAEYVSPTAHRYVLYDPFHRDRAHAEVLAALPGPTTLYRVPFAGHPCSKMLSEIGLISRLTRQILDGDAPSPSLARLAIREKRHASAHYWRGVSNASRRRHPALSLKAARRALEINPKLWAAVKAYERAAAG
jgi:hypothetical protein